MPARERDSLIIVAGRWAVPAHMGRSAGGSEHPPLPSTPAEELRRRLPDLLSAPSFLGPGCRVSPGDKCAEMHKFNATASYADISS